MGRESRLWLKRLCKECNRVKHDTAKGLKEHVRLCKMAHGAGLILPEEDRWLDEGGR